MLSASMELVRLTRLQRADLFAVPAKANLGLSIWTTTTAARGQFRLIDSEGQIIDNRADRLALDLHEY